MTDRVVMWLAQIEWAKRHTPAAHQTLHTPIDQPTQRHGPLTFSQMHPAPAAEQRPAPIRLVRSARKVRNGYEVRQ